MIGDSNWCDVDLKNVKNISINEDSVKAYMFSNEDYSTNVISIKGTSLYWYSSMNDEDYKLKSTVNVDRVFGKGTGYNDKYNDNLFLSCCFYKESKFFSDIKCNDTLNVGGQGSLVPYDKLIDDVFEEKKECSKRCYKRSLDFELNYFNIGKQIVELIKKEIQFDTTNIIFTGHSLGGVLATMLGIYYNKPVVTFETPGEKHYIEMTELFSLNRQFDQIYHFGHDADPIFTGNCGYTCSMIGYSIDTKCHIGKTCTYKAKEKMGLTESILNHRIDYVINKIIGPKWDSDFPECITNDDCEECAKYEKTT
jgi:lipase ATG15